MGYLGPYVTNRYLRLLETGSKVRFGSGMVCRIEGRLERLRQPTSRRLSRRTLSAGLAQLVSCGRLEASYQRLGCRASTPGMPRTRNAVAKASRSSAPT